MNDRSRICRLPLCDATLNGRSWPNAGINMPEVRFGSMLAVGAPSKPRPVPRVKRTFKRLTIRADRAARQLAPLSLGRALRVLVRQAPKPEHQPERRAT